MIKNSKQRKVADLQLKEIEENLNAFTAENIGQDVNTAKHKLGLASFNRLLNKYKKDILEFDELQANGMKVIRKTNIRNLASILIKARLGKKMTQKEIADNIGIDEQQIQRYEANDFESAKWTRILEVIEALDVNIDLQNVVVGNIDFKEQNFSLPIEFTEDRINQAANTVRKNHSLLAL